MNAETSDAALEGLEPTLPSSWYYSEGADFLPRMVLCRT